MSEITEYFLVIFQLVEPHGAPTGFGPLVSGQNLQQFQEDSSVAQICLLVRRYQQTSAFILELSSQYDDFTLHI
jgi:hypothetical protein